MPRDDQTNRSKLSLRPRIWVLGVLLGALGSGCGVAETDAAPIVTGLDHIPIAVANLEQADETYRRLGFTLKPGRRHDDGIRNEIVKFTDGTALELITAVRSTDALTAEYRQFLENGDGAAFLDLRTPNLERLEQQLDDAGLPYQTQGGGQLVSFPVSSRLHHLFFGPRIPSRTDSPAYLHHQNTADGLIGVWIAADDPVPERQLLTRLGMSVSQEQACTPRCEAAPVWRFSTSTIIPLPASRQLAPGRPIVGAVLRVQDLGTAVSYVRKVVPAAATVVHAAQWDSVFIPPEVTHGIWLELREIRTARK